MAAPNPLPPDNSTPDLPAKSKARRFVQGRLVATAFVTTFIIALVTAFATDAGGWAWDKLKNQPIVWAVVNSFKQPIPRADPSRFSILVARLEHDSDDEHHRLVMQSLNEFKGIQVRDLGQQIAPESADAGVVERLGHDQARRHLVEFQAQVVLWGMVLKQGELSRPKLYWTAAPTTRLSKDSDRYPANHHDLRLPELFRQDLTTVLGTVALTQASEFDAQRGRFLADLKPFIDKLRTLLSASAVSTPWPQETRTRFRVILADALLIYGGQSDVNAPLQDAADIYKDVLREYTPEHEQLDWSAIQNNLGNALRTLGERESGTASLEEAVAAYRNALLGWTQEFAPEKWAGTQNNLGNALWRLGEREGGTARLEEAVTAYRAALLERTKKRVLRDLAMTQNNLCNALSTLGERESDTVRLEEAVAACRDALLILTRNESLEWAAAQNNLGAALQTLDERENSTARLEEAVAAYRNALLEWTRERAPLHWAGTQNNLGVALRTLGARHHDTALLCPALEYRLAALEVFAAADAPYFANSTRAEVAADIEALKAQLDPSDYAACLARHQQRIEHLMTN